MGKKNLAVLTGDHINKEFLLENVWRFCQVAQKSGHNNEVTIIITEVAVKCGILFSL